MSLARHLPAAGALAAFFQVVMIDLALAAPLAITPDEVAAHQAGRN